MRGCVVPEILTVVQKQANKLAALKQKQADDMAQKKLEEKLRIEERKKRQEKESMEKAPVKKAELQRVLQVDICFVRFESGSITIFDVLTGNMFAVVAFGFAYSSRELSSGVAQCHVS